MKPAEFDCLCLSGLFAFEFFDGSGLVVLGFLGFAKGFGGGFGFEALAEVFIADDLEAPVIVFDECRHGFDPVAGVQVVDIADHFVFRSVDMATDDTGALALTGEVLQLVFVFADKADGGLHLGFNGLAEGEVFFATP